MLLNLTLRDGTREAHWDCCGGYSGLVSAVKYSFADDEKQEAVKGLYYTDADDGDIIAVHTDRDVLEFVEHITSRGIVPALLPVSTGESDTPCAATLYVQTDGDAPNTHDAGESNSYASLQQAHLRETLGAPVPCLAGSFPEVKPRCLPLKNWGKGQLLGAGSSGKVYLGIDHDTGDLFAVKELLYFGNSDQTTRSARREIDLMRPLGHANIVRYLGAQETSTALHVMMEYVPGGSISNLLAKLGPFGEQIIRLYTMQICAGLTYLHERCILHRDIKGGNCLVGIDGTVKLADFGCSINLGTSGALGSEAGTQSVTGTSLWMSPEAVKCSSDITLLSDIWSLGCTIVEMASGRPPWCDAHFANEWAAMFYISSTKTGPPIPPTLSRQAHNWLDGCFHITPSDRCSLEYLLQHDFLATPFEENSDNPALLPPLQSELHPQPIFPSVDGHAADATVGGPAPDQSLPRLGSSFGTIGSAHGDSCFTPLLLSSNEEAFPDIAPCPAGAEPTRTGVDTVVGSRNADPGGTHLPALTPGGPVGLNTAGDTFATDTGLQAALQRAVPAPPRTVPLRLSRPPSGARLAHVPLQGGIDDGLSGVCDGTIVSHPGDITDFLRNSNTFPAPALQPPLCVPSAAALATEGAAPLRNPPDVHRRSPRSVAALSPESTVRMPRPGAFAPAVCKSADKPASALLGLADGVVYRVLYWCDNRSLCAVEACSSVLRHMVDAGRNEIVWRKRFVHDCGGVTVIQAALRRNWKLFLAQSFLIRREAVCHPHMSFVRKFTTSLRVYEGAYADPAASQHAAPESVVLKIERKGHMCTAPQLLGSVGKGLSAGRASLDASTVATTSGAAGSSAAPSIPDEACAAQLPACFGGGGQMPPPTRSSSVVAPPAALHTHPLKPILTPPLRCKVPRPSPTVRPLNARPVRQTGSPSRARADSGPAPTLEGTPPPLQLRASQLHPLEKRSSNMSCDAGCASGGGGPTTEGDKADVAAMPTGAGAEGGGGGSGEGSCAGARAPHVATWTPYEYLTEQDKADAKKREERREQSSPLLHEYRILKDLVDNDVKGVLAPMWFGALRGGGTVLALPMSGPSLNELLLFTGNQFSWKTVCLIALRTLDILQAIHTEGIVHGNVAPSNILLRSAAKDEPVTDLVLINFSASRVWRDRKTQRPTPCRSSPKVRSKEQLFFSSVNVQMECTSSPRDDLVSLAYVLFFFQHGKLPWLPVDERTFRSSPQKSKEIIACKKKFLDATKNVIPLQLHHFLRCASVLRANQMPDYPYLHGLV